MFQPNRPTLALSLALAGAWLVAAGPAVAKEKPAPAPEPEKKKGFWGRILGVFTNESVSGEPNSR